MSDGNQAQSDAISDFPTACHVLGSYLMSDGNQAQSDPIRCHQRLPHSTPRARRVLWMELSLAIIRNQTPISRNQARTLDGALISNQTQSDPISRNQARTLDGALISNQTQSDPISSNQARTLDGARAVAAVARGSGSGRCLRAHADGRAY